MNFEPFIQEVMAAWEEGIPCLLALLQEIDKEDGKEDNKEEEGEEADSGLGEDEEELEVDVVEDDEVVVEDDEQDGEVSQEHNGSSSKELTEVQKDEEDDGSKEEELDHLTLMYEVGAKQKAKDCHYETLDKETTKETNKAHMDKTAERLKSEAEFRQDREDIINFVKEQEEAKFKFWVEQKAATHEKEEEIYKDYRSPFIFR